MRSSDSSINSLDFTDVNGRAIFTTTNHPVRFGVNDVEQMRLTSTGLGIGTSSPGYKLDVAASNASVLRLKGGAGAVDNCGLTFAGNASGNLFAIGTNVSNNGTGANFDFYDLVANANRMRLDSSGNLGLGVTPSAWGSGRIAIDMGANAYVGGTSLSHFTNNVFFDGTNFKYKTTAATGMYQISGADHIWFSAPSGTAGNAITFTQAMTLDASGNLLVGGTSTIYGVGGRGNIEINGSSNSILALTIAGSSTNASYLYSTSTDLEIAATGSRFMRFTTNGYERARITSGGDLLVGKTASNFDVAGVELKPTGNIRGTSDGATVLQIHRLTSDGYIAEFWRSTNFVGNISVTSSATAYNTSSDYRLKDNQQPLTDSGAFIDALQPKTWNWKADGSKGVGFIAHEVQAVSPNSVVGEKDAVDAEGKPIMQAMEYGSAEFIANIIAELQSLRQRVAQLEGTQP
jgi:hypothetical protein